MNRTTTHTEIGGPGPPVASPETGPEDGVVPGGAAPPGPERAPRPAESPIDPLEGAGALWIRRGPRESRLDYDRRWRRDVYCGDEPQLTPRAVLTGMLLGAGLAVSNLYVGLKVGWALGIAITAVVVSVALWRGLARVGVAGRPMSVLEQNCMQSTASAAGHASVAAMVTAVPAYMMVTGLTLQPIWLVLWVFFVSMLGVFLSAPFKRQFLHYERLPWPSSVAAAQTLRSLHAEGRRAGWQARQLFGAAGVAATIRFAIDNTFSWWKLPPWPATIDLPARFFGHPAAAYTVGLDASALYYAAGAILGLRISTWMLVGSAAVWLGFAPWLVGSGRIPEPGYGSVMMSGALWAAASLLVSSSLTSLVLQWRVLWRGLGGMGRMARPGEGRAADPLADLEVPATWWIPGALVCAGAVLVIGEFVLGIPWPLALFGVAVSAALVGVSIRATGETDITPAGPLARLVQLGYGLLAPGAMASNLMGTSIFVSSGPSASDTSSNLKCGHLLGAHPRRQFLAQAFGVVIGAAVVVPTFALLVPDADVLGSDALPAPAAVSFRVVAEVVGSGLGALDPLARGALLGGGLLGVLLALGGLLGHRQPRWWPSPVGLGIGMILGFGESAAFFVGAALAAWVMRRRPRDGQDGVIAVSAGGIAGDSLMGVLIALLVGLGWMVA